MIIFLMLLAFVGGGATVFFVADGPRRRAAARLIEVNASAARLADDEEAHRDRVRTLRTEASRVEAFAAETARQKAAFDQALAAHDKNVIAYADLARENAILKADVRGGAVAVARQEFEADRHRQWERDVETRIAAVARRHLDDSLDWGVKSLTRDNFAAAAGRLRSAVERVRAAGAAVSPAEENDLLDRLRAKYEAVVRVAQARDEQARIRENIREEAKREKEVREAVEQAAREQRAVEDALAKVLAEVAAGRDADAGRHAGEIELLKARLADAEAKSVRAKSQAELTRTGNVYVISNVGSFGDGVYKIGMTRRLTPQDRVDELGDASVPFPFDVHMMIACPDAPKLENALHQVFQRSRVNKTNPRKEFFRVPLADIARAVGVHHGKVEYAAEPEALQFRQSQTMSPEDQDFVERVFGEADGGPAAGADADE